MSFTISRSADEGLFLAHPHFEWTWAVRFRQAFQLFLMKNPKITTTLLIDLWQALWSIVSIDLVNKSF